MNIFSCLVIFQEENVVLAFTGTMLILALAELVISIWSAVLCCGVVCRCCRTEAPAQVMLTQHQIVVPQTAAPVGIYNISQPSHQQNQYTACKLQHQTYHKFKWWFICWVSKWNGTCQNLSSNFLCLIVLYNKEKCFAL